VSVKIDKSLRLCTEKATGDQYAVKIVSKRHRPMREVSILQLCQGHPNIVTLHEVLNDELHIYLVMEVLGGGELLERLRRESGLTEARASSIFLQLVHAVQAMHSKRVVHRDLKPENLLFTSRADDATLKVIDFGFACVLPETRTLTTPCYTLAYAAPEVLSTRPGGGYNDSCDLWSLGVILYTMLCGHAPFYGQSLSTEEIMERIQSGQFSLDGPEWEGISPSARHLIEGLLTVDADSRLTLGGVLGHPWLTPATAPATPLLTSCVLGREKGTASAIKHTFHAFHQVDLCSS
jgi:ribosomal protein S6 kinase alpha-5